MFDILGIIESVARQVAGQVGDSIASVVSKIGSDINSSVITPVVSDVSSVVRQIGDSVTTLERQSTSALQQTVATVGNVVGTLEQQTVQGFEAGLSAVQSAVASAAAQTQGELQQLVSDIEAGFTAIANGVSSEFERTVAAIAQQLDDASTRVANAIEPVFDAITKLLESIPPTIEQIGTDIADAAKATASELEKIASNTGSQLKQDWEWIKANGDWKHLATEFSDFGADLPSELEAVFSKMDGIDPRYLELETVPQIGALGAAFDLLTLIDLPMPNSWFFIGAFLDRITGTALTGALRNLHQAANAGSRNELLTPGQLVEGKYKGVVDDNQYIDEMRMHGFSDERMQQAFDIANTPLSMGEILGLWWRGIIPDASELITLAKAIRADEQQLQYAIELSKRLISFGEAIDLWRRGISIGSDGDPFDDVRGQGWTDDRIDAIKAASYRLPSIFDQQEFIRRNVDDPAYVEKYGLDYGLDDEYFRIARANGFDRDTALRMYRRYWSIPPFFITEGLYRTGKLSADSFKQLLIAEGYTPQWADQFIDQLKPTLTLSDIKELYKYQVITADEIVAKVVSIGYTQDLAEQYKELWVASVKLAAPIEQTDAQASGAKLKGDTESLITTGYKDHVLTRSQAYDALKSINYTDDAANLILEIADYQLQQQAVKDTYSLAKDQYLAGQISLNDALQELITAGATHDQVVQYQLQLQKAGAAKPKTPTLSEFGAWYKKGIIDETMLAQGISLLGYSDTWIPFYMLYFGVPAKTVAAMYAEPAVPVV